jgi:hypothetical protein
MRKEKKSLAETHPEIAKQWHPSKNGDLTPYNLTYGSNKKVWWKCNKVSNHEWEASIKKRCNFSKCPLCDCLATLNPEIAKEWHPTLNEGLTAYDFKPGSNKKVWWKCPKGDDHEWLEIIYSRVKDGNGCTICSNRKVVLSNCLATTHPEIAKEWHPTKNSDLTPYKIAIGSSKKAWWKCPKGEDHEWRTKILIRKNSSCPICTGKKLVHSNSLKIKKPEISKEWHPTKNNDLKPINIYYSSTKKVWWKCPKGDDHEWSISPQSRSNGSGCPICANQKVVISNCLATTHPKIAQKWHSSKNGKLTPDNVVSRSGKKVWWKCDKGDDHVWRSTICSITNGNSCPMCANRKISKTNSLVSQNPVLASEWHKEKNVGFNLNQVIYGGKNIYWWKCAKGKDHIWRASLENRKKGKGCPICTNQKVVISNCLATTHPKIAKEWHPTKNGNLSINDVVSGSGKKVWWKCDKGDDHEWETKILNRAELGAGCLICSNQITVFSNSIANLSPELTKEWHPKKNRDLKPSDLGLGSNKKVWWICDKGSDHEWKTSPNKRTSGRNCPFCTLTPQSKQELIITFELKKLFKNIDPKGLKTKLDGKLRSIDIFIPKLNLCIEFDGSYWHKDKRDIDKIKSEMLFKEGFKLIRVREEPLKKIYDTDIISKQPYDGKQVANDILSMIISIFNLEDKLVFKIKEYQSKEDLQNEKGLEKYIDKILTEKAEKKNNS